MGEVFKVVVTGPFNVGKTEFIRTISDIPIVTTEKRITDHLAATKEETTVAMDYGQVRIGEDLFHLYGTPGQPRFDFMWDILSKEMHAFILLVDSSDVGGLMEARQFIRIFSHKGGVPYLIAANKQDKENVLPVEEIARRLGVDGKIRVVPCVATDRASVYNVLKELQALLH
ncbi:MAG: ADP-ribosylation factor-like protein [Anaerolineae bacterium]|nr:ADP-ribosylation factor-like protein [Anaerolineae bacterium]